MSPLVGLGCIMSVMGDLLHLLYFFTFTVVQMSDVTEPVLLCLQLSAVLH